MLTRGMCVPRGLAGPFVNIVHKAENLWPWADSWVEKKEDDSNPLSLTVGILPTSRHAPFPQDRPEWADPNMAAWRYTSCKIGGILALSMPLEQSNVRP